MIEVKILVLGFSVRWKVVQFLIDTGSTNSCVHPDDARNHLNISDLALNTPSLWQVTRPAFGIGGAVSDYLVPAQYALERDDDTWAMHREDLAIARPTPLNQTFPSLLGWDILRHYRIVADWSAGSVRLETP